MITLRKGVAATITIPLITEPEAGSALEFRVLPVSAADATPVVTKTTQLTASGLSLTAIFTATELDDVVTDIPVVYQVWATPVGQSTELVGSGVMSLTPGARVIVSDPPAPHARSQQPALFRVKRGSTLKLRFQVLREAEPVDLSTCTDFKFSLVHPTLRTEELSFLVGGTNSALVVVNSATGTFDLTATAATMLLPLASYIAAFQFTHPDDGLVEVPSDSPGYRWEVVQDFLAAS